jgi:broad-specificity NMP kinase
MNDNIKEEIEIIVDNLKATMSGEVLRKDITKLVKKIEAQARKEERDLVVKEVEEKIRDKQISPYESVTKSLIWSNAREEVISDLQSIKEKP